ncbi:MAG: ATP-binding cassette domain-containing protein [Methylocystaceae bacterium]
MRIELEGVSLRIGHRTALHDINLVWTGPGLFLITGSPGAGKSLLLRLTGGLTSFNGNLSREYQGCGYLPQLFNFYPNLTPIEFFDYLLLLEGVAERRQRARTIQALVARADLDRQAHQRMGSLPLSARQRIAIVQSLIGNPECLIWDTPENNLRNAGQEWLMTMIDRELSKRLLIVATDNVELYEQRALRIAVLHDGNLLFEGSRDQLLASTDGQVWEGKIPFKHWQKFRLENIVTQADIVDGGIMVRILGPSNPDYCDFVPARGTANDAVELMIQSASLHKTGTEGADLNNLRRLNKPARGKGTWS